MLQKILKKESEHSYKKSTVYKTDSCGQEWILKDTTIKVKGFDTGLIGGKSWFKVSDRDERGMLWITSLFGAFGIHKLITGNITAFAGYLLTCGGFGVLTVLDVLAFLTGSAGYYEVTYREDEEGTLIRDKRRVFYRKLEQKWIVPLGIICAFVVTTAATHLVYKPLMVKITESTVNIAADMDKETASDNLKIMEQVLDYDLY